MKFENIESLASFEARLVGCDYPLISLSAKFGA